MKPYWVIALILLSSIASFAQAKSTKNDPREELLITALVNSKTLPPIWGDDGFRGSAAGPELARIFRLGSRAIPLLIEHLDDRRVFVNMVRRDQGDLTGVTVGEGALNILECIVREQAPVFDTACVKAEHRGEDSCLNDGFLPGQRGKRNWTKAYRNGEVLYEQYDF